MFRHSDEAPAETRAMKHRRQDTRSRKIDDTELFTHIRVRTVPTAMARWKDARRIYP